MLELPARVAVDSRGPDFPTLDDRCRRVGFAAAGEIWVADLSDGRFVHVSVGPGGRPADQRSGLPALSGDGRRIAFDSAASNLVPGPQNRHDHVFLRDLGTWAIERVSRSTAGEPARGANLAWGGGISLSRDGRTVAFPSHAANLVPGDTNHAVDVFVRDTREDRTFRASVASDGGQGDGDSGHPSLSADGRRIAFASDAANLVADDGGGRRDVFVRDLAAGVTRRVSRAHGGGEADGPSDAPALSADGRWVAFASEATNLVPDDRNGARDVFLHDLASGRTVRIGVGRDGAEPDGASDLPAPSGDGARVAFVSRAANLVPGDANGVPDVFLWDRARDGVARLSVAADGREADDESGAWGLAISTDGRCVAFGSFAGNLVAGDANRRPDVFVAELLPEGEAAAVHSREWSPGSP